MTYVALLPPPMHPIEVEMNNSIPSTHTHTHTHTHMHACSYHFCWTA